MAEITIYALLAFCPREIRAKNGRQSAIARVSTPEKKQIYESKRFIAQSLRHGYGSAATREKIRHYATLYPEIFGSLVRLL